jgi:hypothetical protein
VPAALPATLIKAVQFDMNAEQTMRRKTFRNAGERQNDGWRLFHFPLWSYQADGNGTDFKVGGLTKLLKITKTLHCANGAGFSQRCR